MKRFKNDKEAIDALDSDPVARSLLEDLEQQTPDRIDQLMSDLVTASESETEDDND